MKKIQLILLLLLVCSGLLAQDKNSYDTLYQRVNNLTSDKIIDLGDSYLAKSNEDTAIVLYSIAYSRFNDNMDEKEKLLCVLCFLKTGNIYFRQGNYNNAFDFYMKGLYILESCSNKQLLSQFYMGLGSVYCIFLDYEKGINCFEKAYDYSHIYPDKRHEYNALINMTSAYNYLHDTAKAKEYYYKAKQMTKPADTIRTYMNILNWGLILLDEKKTSEAIRSFHEATRYARDNNLEPRYECSTYEELYKLYMELGDNDSTLVYLKRCNLLAEQHGLVDILSLNLKSYANFYKKQGDLANSLHYESRYLTLTDSVFNVREFNRIKNLQYLYEMGKIGKEISSLNEEKQMKEVKIKRQQGIMFGIALGTLILGTLLVIVYRQKKRLAEAYKNLFDINQGIAASDSYNKTVRIQYEEKLRQKDKELEAYKRQQGGAVEEISSDSDASSKYHSSNLADEQKQNLLDAIGHIMEMTDEFCKEDFSLDKLASLVNSNSKYVSQIINETYHVNFNSYINEYRIREARLRIADVSNYGHYTIKAIAESVGYKSNATFVNAFKNVAGITPSLFQKKIMEEYKR